MPLSPRPSRGLLPRLALTAALGVLPSPHFEVRPTDRTTDPLVLLP